MLRSIAKLRSIITNRLVLCLVISALLGFFSLGGTNLNNTTKTCASPCHIIENYYYDDATYTHLVGAKIIGCNGSNQWGIVPTPYHLQDEGGCCPICCGP